MSEWVKYFICAIIQFNTIYCYDELLQQFYNENKDENEASWSNFYS